MPFSLKKCFEEVHRIAAGLCYCKEVVLMVINRNYHLKLVAMFTLLIGLGMALIAWVAQPVGAAPHDCGLQIADCGTTQSTIRSPQSAIAKAAAPATVCG